MHLAVRCSGTHYAQCHMSYKKQYQNVNVGQAVETQYNVIRLLCLNALAQVKPCMGKKEKEMCLAISLRCISAKSPSFFTTSPEILWQLRDRVDVTSQWGDVIRCGANAAPRNVGKKRQFL